MRTLIVGLGIQGKKRRAVAGGDVVGTVDIDHPESQYRHIREVPIGSFDSALLCVPDGAKDELITYLLENKKHVLVEKPLIDPNSEVILRLKKLAEKNRVTCYTAYNHRFEPHIMRLKSVFDSGVLGKLYMIKLFYGNGTARDVRNSPWRDKGPGVLPDLGSHMLDMIHFLVGRTDFTFTPWSFDRFENRSFDHVHFGGAASSLKIDLEATLMSWRNSFRADVFAEKGSAHIDCLCKWGPSVFTLRSRILPSGRPTEESVTLTCPDPTWQSEYAFFKDMCERAENNLGNDIWINDVLNRLAQEEVQ